MNLSSPSPGRLERWGRRCLPPTLEKLGPALLVAANAAGKGLQKVGLVDPPGPKPQADNLFTAEPGVEIERPVLFVPGYNTAKDRFGVVAAHLARPSQNGGRPYYLRGSQVFLDADCSQPLEKIPSQARVFIAVMENPLDAPPKAAPQLGQALEAIREATGSPKVDVEAYSMGGLTTRYYLQQGGDAVGKLLMVGTPNVGAGMSESALKILDLHERGWDMSWIMARRPLALDHREALTWLLPVENPQAPLRQLNGGWDQQRARLEEALAVGTSSVKTFDRQFWRVPGDGMVTTQSMALPGLATQELTGVPYPKHRYLFANPEVVQVSAQFFGWKPLQEAGSSLRP